jgi:hypothetical protein
MYTQDGIENHLILLASPSSYQQSKQFGGWGACQFPIGE